MLACNQDLFFQNNGINTANFQKGLHDPTLMTMSDHKDKRIKCQQQRKDSLMSTTSDSDNDLSDLNGVNSNNNNNMKDKEEQVWPPDVEAAFIEALESIPKLGRRKILVNGKPCGRNELISDFIYRKTCKIRTRKQVSSHIQVLKNTRKGDSHFMRLLTDSVDVDDSNAVRNNNVNTMKTKPRPPHHHNMPHHIRHPHHPANKQPPMGVKMKTYQSIDSLSSDESSINSSPSPTDYVFDIMYGDSAQQQMLSMLQFKDIYDPMQQSLFSGMMNPVTGLSGLMDTSMITTDPFFGSTNMLNSTTPDILTPLLGDLGDKGLLGTTESMITSCFTDTNNNSTHVENLSEEELLMQSLEMLKRKSVPSRKSSTSGCSINKKRKSMHDSPDYALWPNYLCLYLEYTMPYEPCRPLSHNLSQLPHCHAGSIPTVSSDAISSEKCPLITSLAQNAGNDTALLLAKTKLDLNLNIADFAFNNTSFFETQTRRTIECTTTIYSFGNVVLESKEVQQALWVNEGKYMYSFVFVNQFFDAFMKGIRSLQSWDEVDIAINNLCIVQSFEDVESKQPSPSATTSSIESESKPLLVTIYEFERGNGTIEVSHIGDASSSSSAMSPEDELEFLDQDM